MAKAAHIRIAQQDGPKAGFKAYLATLERAGLPQVREALDEILATGNKKAQFDFYCAKYGRYFVTPNATPDVDEDDEISALQARIDALKARVTTHIPGGRSGSKGKARTATRTSSTTRKATASKPAVFRQWALNKHPEISTTVGATFTYKGKNTNTRMIVVSVEGKKGDRVVTCERI